MMWSLAALVIGFGIDLLVGDPHSFPHPVVLIGKCISVLERALRRSCPKTPAGERAAGAILWGAVVIVSTAVPAGLLWLCGLVSPWLRLALESVHCTHRPCSGLELGPLRMGLHGRLGPSAPSRPAASSGPRLRSRIRPGLWPRPPQ